MLNGKYLRNELSPYLFNRKVERAYLDSIAAKKPLDPPEIQIELFLRGDGDALEDLRGNGNSEKNDNARGLLFSIEFDRKYDGAYSELLKNQVINSIPLEFYQVQWSEFPPTGGGLHDSYQVGPHLFNKHTRSERFGYVHLPDRQGVSRRQGTCCDIPGPLQAEKRF